MILTNKLKSYRGDLQLHLYEDDIQTVHTIPSRNGTIGEGVLIKFLIQLLHGMDLNTNWYCQHAK